MALFLLILLVLAAAAGVLGAVLNAKRRFRAVQRDVDARYSQDRRRREAYDVRSDPRQGPARGLGDGS